MITIVILLPILVTVYSIPVTKYSIIVSQTLFLVSLPNFCSIFKKFEQGLSLMILLVIKFAYPHVLQSLSLQFFNFGKEALSLCYFGMKFRHKTCKICTIIFFGIVHISGYHFNSLQQSQSGQLCHHDQLYYLCLNILASNPQKPVELWPDNWCYFSN